VRARELVCWTLVLVAAGAWWLAPWRPGLPFGWSLVKGAPALLLAWIVWSAAPKAPDTRLLALSLGLDGAGDLLLERWFLAGAGVFAAAHLVATVLFWRRHRSARQLDGADHLRTGSLAVAGALLLAGLAPRLDGVYRWAVPAYAALLLVMSGSAQLSRRGRPWLPLGGILFMISDALLALDRFGSTSAGSRLVWPLYVAALAMFVFGWLHGSEEPPEDEDDVAETDASANLDGASGLQ
jgi:uncharacterized membrane protein YhhN